MGGRGSAKAKGIAKAKAKAKAKAHLVHVENFARRLLHLTHLVHKVPETGLGLDLVQGKELHAVRGGVLLLVRLAVDAGGLAADHLV